MWDKIASFIGGFSPTTLGIASAAAAIVLVAQAATIGVLMTREKAAAPGYVSASGPVTPAGEGVQALVTLQPGVTASALTESLKDLKAAIVDGPKAGNIYRLRIAGDKNEAPAALARIKARTDVFAFVGPTSP